MPSVRQVLPALARQALTGWQVDFTDTVDMARLRARVSGTITATSMPAVVATMVWSPVPVGPHAWRYVLVLLAVMAVVTAWTTVRRHRVGDREFAAVILSGIAVTFAAAVVPGGPQIDSNQVSLIFLMPTLVAATFCGRRSHVLLIVTAAIVGVVTAGGRTAASTAGQISTGFTVVVVATLVRLLKELATDAVERARRGEVTDPLTGLSNRRGLERAGRRRWPVDARGHRSLTFLVIDVDHFKQVNDTYGHSAGDDLLRRLGEVLVRTTREEDIVVRLGGEEFLVICDGALTDGWAMAERIRQVVEDSMTPVTVSIGVHEVSPQPDDVLPDRLWAAVAVADEALYAAKENGRNRIEVREAVPAR